MGGKQFRRLGTSCAMNEGLKEPIDAFSDFRAMREQAHVLAAFNSH